MMIRLRRASDTALLLMLLLSVDQACAVSLSPVFTDESSPSRFESSSSANVKKPPTPTPTISERTSVTCMYQGTTAGVPDTSQTTQLNYSVQPDGSVSVSQQSYDKVSNMSTSSKQYDCSRQ
jgi:hypothetical protein